jgi:hypothetical protein
LKKIQYFCFSFFYQKNRFERLNSLGHHLGEESDKYVGSSAATTVVRKGTHATITSTLTGKGKTLHRTSNSSDIMSRSNPIEQNHKVLTNKHALEQHQHRASMKQPSTKTSPDPFHNTYSGQQILLTSGDIEAMTMKQFRIGSLGC